MRNPSKALRVVFAGTPDFALPSLQVLHGSNVELLWVYTTPDAVAGRGQRLRPSSVKRYALEHDIPCFQPSRLGSEEAKALQEAAVDVLVVVAYGKIVPQGVLDAPRYGGINVHGSVLPRWRGAAPIQRAILAGDESFGVSIMQMDAGLDTGPVYKVATLSGARDSAGVLSEKLAQLGADTLLEVLGGLDAYQPVVQPATGSSYAAKIQKQEALLDWSLSAQQLSRCVRAYNPWPMAFFFVGDDRVRVLSAYLVHDHKHSNQVGSIVAITEGGVDVACGVGVLRLELLQLSGKKPKLATDIARDNAWYIGLSYAEGNSC